jgi:helix-turn-helix protein
VEDDLRSRLEAVERRLDQLDRLEGQPPAAPGVDDGRRFWVLEGIKARLPAGTGGVLLAGVAPLPTGEHYEWQYGQPTERLLTRNWAELSKALAALGHPVRLRLLQLILTGTRSSADLQAADELGTSGQLYHHLRQLVAAGWLVQTVRGQYTVPGDRVVPLLVLLLAAAR